MSNIDPRNLNEKQRIELATAISFLDLYNEAHASQLKVIKLSDTPDVICRDISSNELLDLEITLLEDREDDIRYLLGKVNIEDELSISRVIDFERDAIPRLIQRLEDKLLSSYGENTALVIRQVGPLWTVADWQRHGPTIISKVLKGKESNYGKGVWILCSNTSAVPVSDDLFCLYDDSTGAISIPELHHQFDRIVGKVAWENQIPDDFKKFTKRDDVDPVVRIASPHGCEYAIIIAFVSDDPQDERDKAIEFYCDQMVYFCPCGRGSARMIGNWLTFRE